LSSAETPSKAIKVLFVCMGNICRSPTAHAVFQKFVDDIGLNEVIEIDSAGTYGYHIGKKPDSRATSAAANRGYDLSVLRARKIEQSDFEKFDYLLAMDSENYEDLESKCDRQYKHKIKLFLEFAPHVEVQEVPDPYYGGLKGFEAVLDLVEDASKGLLKHIKLEHFK